jgi:hypothetical protein
VTCIPAIFALISGGVEEELIAVGAQHDLVELLWHELVAVHLVNLLALSHSDLTSKAGVHWSFPYVLLDCATDG